MSGGLAKEYWMPDDSCGMCYECDTRFTALNRRHHCRSCGRVFCGNCMQGSAATGDEGLKFCKFCFRAIGSDGGRDSAIEYDEKFDSFPRERLARFLESEQGSSPHAGASSSTTSLADPYSPMSLRFSGSRSDEEDTAFMGKNYFGPLNEYCQFISDVDASAGDEFYNFKSVALSPLGSPSRMTSCPNQAGFSLSHDQADSPMLLANAPMGQESTGFITSSDLGVDDLENTDDSSNNLSVFKNQYQEGQQPLDFKDNGLIWFPPPPEDEKDDIEDSYFEYDDDDDDVGDAGTTFSSGCFASDRFLAREKSNNGQKEPLRAVVHGHFRALVSQLLKGEGICLGNESVGGEWLEIITSLAWQAANFVKPDTSKGGSMDPGDYVKVKCVGSGRPSESTLVKGIVCTKNIKHKRMTSQYRSPSLLLLGGALEYQKVPNQLASMDTLLQQEIDHLKMTVSRIEKHRPNVLLVEKSVSSYAQEYLLAKEISLVLNIKRPLLERIARCTGAHIVPSIDYLASARLGHCDNFRLERVTEVSSSMDQNNKRVTKTLMFFEGCPRRLGCTVLLRGACHEELKRVKHVVQYAVFAAYHLSLETSFLADEGASLPKMTLKYPTAVTENLKDTLNALSAVSDSSTTIGCQRAADERVRGAILEHNQWDSSCEHSDSGTVSSVSLGVVDSGARRALASFPAADLVSHVPMNLLSVPQCQDLMTSSVSYADGTANMKIVVQESSTEEGKHGDHWQRTGHENGNADVVEDAGLSSEYFSAADNSQSILVSLASRSVLKGTVCHRSQLFRIKFYGNFDKPLGKFLRDDLFDQRSNCQTCDEPAEAHVRCYTHQQGSLNISVRRLSSVKLSGERDGKIWMWHRCLKCANKDGVPPATRRVVMSDAAWGLSFGKFLELSFSNHATANRVASCGHSMQKDCLRFYGFGNMVAFFHYSPIDILSVNLPPPVLAFSSQIQNELFRKEAMEISSKVNFLYSEVFGILRRIEQKIESSDFESSRTNGMDDHIMLLKDLLRKERNEYDGILTSATSENWNMGQSVVDVLELNRLKRNLLIDSLMWDRRLNLLDTCVRTKTPITKVHLCLQGNASPNKSGNCGGELYHQNCSFDSLDIPRDPEPTKQQELSLLPQEVNSNGLIKMDSLLNPVEHDVGPDKLCTTCGFNHKQEECPAAGDVLAEKMSLDSSPSPASVHPDKIDSAWTGISESMNTKFSSVPDGLQDSLTGQMNHMDNLLRKKLMTPMRVHSFDSALKFHDRLRKDLSASSLYLPLARSFHASGDYASLIRDPITNMLRAQYLSMPRVAQKLNFLLSNTPSFVSTASHILNEGPRLLLPQMGHQNIVIAVYDDEPTSIISFALSSKEYGDWIANKLNDREGRSENDNHKDEEVSNLLGSPVAVSNLSAWQSISLIDSDDISFRSHGSDEVSMSRGSLFSEPKRSPHVRVSFSDESSSSAGKVKFSVTCYFANQFDTLRKKCCPSEVDFIRSLSRCKRWSAQGGKSNVYFAKTLDERFIVKQVTKTELESFEKFAPEYFRYLIDSINSGSPTCLAKVLGIYQVCVKHLKGSREVKMDLMVMENLFFGRSISKVYDLKGSARSRYNSDTTGSNKVLLDLNLLETLRTNPMFLGSKAKRNLERAVWNDTSFLASADVMDYSLLVGVDEQRKELVLGIIDFMRPYTWDKHLETWVKASGILGGPKNASPTVISPKQYKKRFRKAMTTYFLTVPDQWSS